MSTKAFHPGLCTAWPTRKISQGTSAPLFRTQAPNEQVTARGKEKRVKHGTRSPSSTVSGDLVGRNATGIQFTILASTKMLRKHRSQNQTQGRGGTREKNEYQNRTSLSALKFQTPYVAPMIPAKAMAVLAFQLEGRVHQPPKTYQPKFLEAVTAQSRNGGRSRTYNEPAGDQTDLGYGYLAPPPYTKRAQQTSEKPGTSVRDRGSDHEFLVREVSFWFR